MLDFLTMEQELGRNLDDYSYAEAAQMYCEHNRSQWQHTSAILAYIAATNADPKKGKRYKPDDFNPWEGGRAKKGIRLTRANLHVMQAMAHNVKNRS